MLFGAQVKIGSTLLLTDLSQRDFKIFQSWLECGQFRSRKWDQERVQCPEGRGRAEWKYGRCTTAHSPWWPLCSPLICLCAHTNAENRAPLSFSESVHKLNCNSYKEITLSSSKCGSSLFAMKGRKAKYCTHMIYGQLVCVCVCAHECACTCMWVI